MILHLSARFGIVRRMRGSIKKTEEAEDLQIAWAAVYAPGVPDAVGEFMTAEEIQKSYLDFAINGDRTAIDLMHNNQKTGCTIVEMFLSRPGDPDFPIPGTWVVALYVPDKALWAAIKDGTFNGVSMEVYATRHATILEIEIPEVVRGSTMEAEGHTHRFSVMYDEDGRLIGGKTDVHTDKATGVKHYHVIKRGTATEDAEGSTGEHSHRFAVVDFLMSGGSEADAG
jgi:hypothetical protein